MKRISSNSSHASLPLKIGKFVALRLCKKSPYVLCRLFKKHDIKEDNGESFDVPDMDLKKALEEPEPIRDKCAKLEENPVFHIPPKEDSSSSGSSNFAFASNGDNNNFDTSFIIRSRQTQRADPTFNSQGNAPRRIRLQKKLHMGPVTTQARPTMPMVTEEKEAKHSPTASDAASTTASDDASTTASDDTSTTGDGFDQELSSKVKPKAEFLICFRVHMPKVLLVISLCLGAASLWSCLAY
ncbi:hypothetical protein Tco_1151347 [Tanacetum coccineum]